MAIGAQQIEEPAAIALLCMAILALKTGIGTLRLVDADTAQAGDIRGRDPADREQGELALNLPQQPAIPAGPASGASISALPGRRGRRLQFAAGCGPACRVVTGGLS